MSKGTIFNIQKMSIHDGPGIRTTVFFKGCPLKCLWCSNPESQAFDREIAIFSSRCVKCGYCAEVCPKGIVEKAFPYGITDREACDLCEVCVKECCTGAKDAIGIVFDVPELLKEILKDKSFYESSGGGVTFSGGEPLMQMEFLKEILKACKDEGVHTCIETTGLCDDKELPEIAQLLDLIFVDIKHMDDEVHKKVTGASNKVILENIAKLAKLHGNIIARIPVIPGINDSEENIAATAKFVSDLGIGCLELLPYHNLGEVKYAQLGMEYELSDVVKPTEEIMAAHAEVARKAMGDTKTSISIMKSL